MKRLRIIKKIKRYFQENAVNIKLTLNTVKSLISSNKGSLSNYSIIIEVKNDSNYSNILIFLTLERRCEHK